MTDPDISYVVSNYNSAHFLSGLLTDLLEGQSHKNIEVIVVDSASTDNSVEVVEAIDDPRLLLIKQPERTPYGVSWLEGWKVARGKIVANSNTDDRSYPWRSTQVLIARSRAKEKPVIGRPLKYHFYYGGYETCHNGQRVTAGCPPRYTEEDMSQFFRCGVHVHWDNDLRDEVDWDRMMKAGREYTSAFDYWLVLYFISLDAYGISIQSCFSIYNQRPDSVEQANKELSTFESLRAIEEFYPEGTAISNLETKTKQDSPDFYRRYREFCERFK